MTKSKLGVLTLVVVIFGITVAGGYTIGVYEDDDLGYYLVDENRLALYYYVGDSAGISKLQTNDDAWVPFYTEEDIEVPPGEGLDALDFTTITGYDGKDQIAYRDWPLYRYTKDEDPGDHEGHDDKMKLLDPLQFPPDD